MDRDTETFELVADGMAQAVTRAARECKSAAVVALDVELHVTYPERVYHVGITKVRSSSGARSLDRVERWRVRRKVLLREAEKLTARLAKIEAEADRLLGKLADVDALEVVEDK